MRYISCLIVCFVLATCGSAAKAGDATRGAALFSGAVALRDGPPACNTCHIVQAGVPSTVGPNLSNIGNWAATRVGEQTAQQYLRTSIIDPDAYLAPNFQEGIMYNGYRQALAPQQIDDLVAYLLTLRSGNDR